MSVAKVKTPAQFFASFELLSKIGQGGMATVYQARRLGDNSIVALKVALRHIVDDPDLRARFEHECIFSCRFQHPRLVSALEHGAANGIPYLVMEYVPGQPLSKLIRERGCLPESEAMPIILQTAEALAYLHQQKLVHRDVKPENILVMPTGQVKLADLGLIKDLESASPLTKTSAGLGTFEYAAPEQYDDAKHADPRSDVYSLAATMYATLTGTYPFGSSGHTRVLKRKLDNDFEAPRVLQPALSEAVNSAICRALNARREDRHASIAAFTAHLQATHVSGELRRPGAPQRRVTTPHDDRRATIRFEVALPTSCEPVLHPRRDVWQAKVLDVSSQGMCLRVHRRFEVGTLLRVAIQGPKDETATNYHARVRWLKEQSPRIWLLGCVLSQPLAPHELDGICFSGSCRTSAPE